MKKAFILLWLAGALTACNEDNPAVEPAPEPTPPPVAATPPTTPTTPVAEYFNEDPALAPRLMKASYIDLDSIGQISKFRSGIGHDYSDDFESCRSMKHYFKPKTKAANHKLIRIYSPVDGQVVRIFPEWAGSQIHIRSKEHKAFVFRLFHVNLSPGIKEGSQLTAGQQLGTHIGSMTSSDIAVSITTTLDGPKENEQIEKGIRYCSIFQLMSDALFQEFAKRGIADRNAMLITKAQRDQDPLTCQGQYFQSPGTLENWVNLP